MELMSMRDGSVIKVAGAVIVRQRPGTAHGFLFLSLEDETGVANIIVSPDMFEREREAVTQHTFIIVTGILQNQQGSVSVRAAHVEPFRVTEIPVPTADYQMPVPSHDFH
jgi:error-prone DNA polymerase